MEWCQSVKKKKDIYKEKGVHWSDYLSFSYFSFFPLSYLSLQLTFQNGSCMVDVIILPKFHVSVKQVS